MHYEYSDIHCLFNVNGKSIPTSEDTQWTSKLHHAILFPEVFTFPLATADSRRVHKKPALDIRINKPNRQYLRRFALSDHLRVGRGRSELMPNNFELWTRRSCRFTKSSGPPSHSLSVVFFNRSAKAKVKTGRQMICHVDCFKNAHSLIVTVYVQNFKMISA